MRLELAGWLDASAPEAGDPNGTPHATRAAALRARHAALSAKRDAIESPTRTDLELWQRRRSTGLEWTNVLLIVVDIVLAVL